MKKLNVAVIGQGRSGKNIHGKFLESDKNIFFNVKYVVDASKERREIAKKTHPECETFENYQSLFDKKDIDLVVNATYSHMHYAITKDLLMHKFNVLSEKPFARNRYEADDLIKTAKDNGVLLTVFHQSLVSPFFVKAKEILASGLIGEPTVINIRYSGFARRWDWQTLRKKMAGSVYNTGPHPLGIGMDLLGFGEDIKVAYSYLDTAFTSGDGEDVAKIILTGKNKRPVVDIEIDSNDAFSDYNLKIQGTRGTMKCTQEKIFLKYYKDSENEERPVIEEFIHDENFGPVYCKEDLKFHEEEIDVEGSVFFESVGAIYENLYYALTEGRELIVDPVKIARLMGIVETVHGQNPLPLKF